MTAEDQVKEIIKLMAPEGDPSQQDALFLVTRYMELAQFRLKEKEKQIALLEAVLEERSKEKQDVINEKLLMETKLRKEKEDLIAEGWAVAKATLKPNKEKTL